MNTHARKASGAYIEMRLVFLLFCALTMFLQTAGASTQDIFDPAAHEGKVVIVDFWASWCVPCRRSFPWLNSMHDKYADEGLVIIGVNLDQEDTAAREFLAEFPPRFSIVYDTSKELAKEFGVVAMPTSYLIGRDGEIREHHYGFKIKKQDEYEAAIVAALNEIE